MNLLPIIVSVSDLQRDSARIIKLVKASDQPVIVMRNNKAEVAMIDVRKLQKILDHIKDLETRELLRGINETEVAFTAGNLKSTTNFSEFLND